jgi:hypothetical protein
MLPISQRNEPTEIPCPILIKDDGYCDGVIKQIIAAPYFGYDNIHTRHSTNNKEPGWFKDKMTDMKKNMPGNTL